MWVSSATPQKTLLKHKPEILTSKYLTGWTPADKVLKATAHQGAGRFIIFGGMVMLLIP